MLGVCRSGGQRLLLAAAAVLVLLLVLLMVQPRLEPVGSVMVQPRLEPVGSVQPRLEPVGSVQPRLEPVGSVQPRLEPVGSVMVQPWLEPVGSVTEPTAGLQQLCSGMQRTRGGLAPDVRQTLAEVCHQIGEGEALPSHPSGCNKAVTYDGIGRLGNLMGLYGIIYGFSRMYGATGYVESDMWSKLHKYFPDISLQSTKFAPAGTKWEDITYQQAKAKLECQPGDGPEPRFFRIMDWPARNGIDVFHPFSAELRKEFTFSTALRNEAQEFLRHARGNRNSVTYISFHVRRTDFEAYVRKKYNRTLPDVEYFDRSLDYYRQRFDDALFIVCSDDLDYVTKQLKARQNDDIVIAGNRDIGDPGRDMALLSACNHSVVTVGTYGFWGAYLAGGTVLVPDEKAHLASSDGSAPLLVIQRAGATNWVLLWS